MPSGRRAEPLITDNLDRTVTVQFSPSEAGLHEMHIKYNGTHIPGTHVLSVRPSVRLSVCLSVSLYLNILSIYLNILSIYLNILSIYLNILSIHLSEHIIYLSI